MRQRILALAAALSALGAGSVVFLRWETAEVDRVLENPSQWEWVDRDSCTVRACSSNACQRALDHLQDAGSACVPRLVACDFRVSQRMRNCFADAGVAISSKKYQRLELTAIRCPGVDGGLTFGTAFDDAGCPVDAAAVTTPRCVRAPVAGGTGCRRSERDGGFRYFGAGNVFPAAESNGHVSCEPVGCSVVFGDNPDTDL